MNNKKARILLTIKTIQKDKKLSIQKAIKLYNLLYTIFNYKMNDFTPHIEIQTNYYNLTKLKKEMIIQYILNINSKGFLSKLKIIKNIANHIFESKNTKHIKKF